MIRPCNLISILDAKNSLTEQELQKYLKHFGVDIAINDNKTGIKKSELVDIEQFCKKIGRDAHVKMNFFDGFYVGYHIPQIGKEFDLLRIGKEYLVNIEIKSAADPLKVKNQLKMNRYYLKFLKKTFLYSYVVDTDSLYCLGDNDELFIASSSELIDKISCQQLYDIGNIDDLFKPSNYLVSPFNSTDKFITDEYFLTNQQFEIKEKVLALLNNGNSLFIAITGTAGTGKTLLVYDIAKSLINANKKVLILHCAQLNSGQKLLSDAGWTIGSTRYAVEKDFSSFDLIIVDEAQRATPFQFQTIIKKVADKNKCCIFSYDSRQCLDLREIHHNIPKYIESLSLSATFRLTKKIRTNKEIASFIKLLFDKNELKTTYNYSQIGISFFESRKKAKEFLQYLRKDGWRVPKYTPGKMTTFQYEDYLIDGEDSAHAVIGQEFEKVVAVIDEYYYYNMNGELCNSASSWYSQTQMLFQILTRTREKLFVVIIKNPVMLSRCLEIIHGY